MRHWADPHEPLPPPPPQVEKVNKFTQTLVEKLRSELSKMQSKAVNAEKENQVGASLFNRVLPPPNAPSTGPKILPPLPLLSPQATRDLLLKEAARIGDDFLQLEKFVNLNYMVRGLGGRAIARSDSSSARASMIGPA